MEYRARVACTVCDGVGHAKVGGGTNNTINLALNCMVLTQDSVKVSCKRCHGRGFIIHRQGFMEIQQTCPVRDELPTKIVDIMSAHFIYNCSNAREKRERRVSLVKLAQEKAGS